MGLINIIKGYKVCIDTAPFIYFIEENPHYLKTLRPLFGEIAARNIEAITSTITLFGSAGSSIKNWR